MRLLPAAVAFAAFVPLVRAGVTTREDKGLLLTVEPNRYDMVEVESEGRSFRRIDMFGAGRIGEPGRPDLPIQGYWIAVPEGHIARARLVGAEYDDLPGPTVLPARRDTTVGSPGVAVALPAYEEVFYRRTDWYPAEPVTVGEPARFRHQLLVPVRVAPIRVVPSTGLIRVYRKMEVEVEFLPDPAKRGAPAAREPVGDEGRWEEIYRGLLSNYDQGRAFRSRVARVARDGAGARKRAAPLSEAYRILVRETGFYRIAFERFQEDGLSSGIPFSSLEIEGRGYDDGLFESGGDPFTVLSIPFLEEDDDGDGFFESGDALLVYLPGFRDDRMKRDYEDRFAVDAVYFLTVGGERAPMEERTALHAWTGLTSLRSFPDSIRWESDIEYNINTPSDTVDLYFAMGRNDATKTTEVTLPAPDPEAPYGIKAMTVSVSPMETATGTTKTNHRYTLTNSASGDTVFDQTVIGEIPGLFPAEKTRDASTIAAGINRFQYGGSRWTPWEFGTGAGGYLDWYEVHARFLYRAYEDYLLFSNGEATGRYRIEVEGFSDSAVVLFDVTDPYAPVRLVQGSIGFDGSAYVFALEDSAGATRRYAAAVPSAMRTLSSSRIEAVSPADPAGEEGTYLILAHEDFVGGLGDLVSHREAQGYSVRVVPVGEVYDAFNGGVKDPVAIRRFLRYAFERWSTPPGWVLFVGDGYEDYKGTARNYAANPDYDNEIDFIPGYPIYRAQVESSGDHWDTSDQWYVLLDGDSDPLPDLLIGRFPVGRASELEEMVEKTIAYESFDAGDSWRSRVIFLADDGWTFTKGPTVNSGQTQFREHSERFARELKETAARGIDTVGVYLSSYTDIFHPLCPYPSDPDNPDKADVDCVIEKCRADVIPALFGELNGAGALLVNFQGHGNRNVLTHEVILRNGWDYRNHASRDIRSYSKNRGRPYIFMGYGCSIAEFDRFSSFGYESIPEEMVLSDRGGAVASFGSTAIEYLQSNLVLNDSVIKYMFQTPGVIPGADPDSLPAWYGGIPRWTLGEIVALGMADFVAGGGSSGIPRRYVLFGDPALRIDARPPHFEVTVDGETAEDGDPLTGRDDGGPVSIVARVHDEVAIAADSIGVFEAGEALDPSLYTVEADSALAADGRAWTIRYDAEIRFGEYEVLFRAKDANGRSAEFRLRVLVGVSLTFDGATIRDGDYVVREPLIRAEIATPVPVNEEDLVLDLDGAPVEPDSLIPLDGFHWRAALRPLLDPGEHVLAVGVQGLQKSVRFRVEDRLRVVDLLNHPNPVDGETGFFYHLTAPADRVFLEVYTVAGRRIRVIDGLSGTVGYNENPGVWDGRDADGDRIAAGVYVYRLVASGGGNRAEALGKAILKP
ncbi:MAG: hypothetical protein JW958_11925 [Candidatus Eisenbacteria bacterium]|nr:hypothetical protein [Candidatus Eisenbacteria bacterium]